MLSIPYYPIEIHLYSKKYIAFWYTDLQDGVLVDEHNKLIIFRCFEEANMYSSSKHLQVDFTETIKYDFDILGNWLLNPIGQTVDCQGFLNLWNLTIDIAYSCQLKFLGNLQDELTNIIYDKLFYGNNLPCVTPKGKLYKPIWTKEELDYLVKVMENVVFIIEKVCL